MFFGLLCGTLYYTSVIVLITNLEIRFWSPSDSNNWYLKYPEFEAYLWRFSLSYCFSGPEFDFGMPTD